MFINFNFIIISYKCLKCHGCVAEAVSALPGALVRWLVDCSMCVPCAPCAPSWHFGGAGFAPPHNTHSKRSMQSVWEGRPQRTCPQRGTAKQPVQQQQPQGRQQGCSICGEPGHNARTHAQHAAAAATAAAERTARGEYVCGYCQREVSGEERARWLCQLFSVACEASPHLSFSDRIYGMATVQYGPKLYYRASTLTFDIYYSAATLLMT